MLGRFKIKNVFFLELLEFSEDRHRWESVEEKLNAIRYELLAFQCWVFLSFVHLSCFPASRCRYPRLHPHLPLSFRLLPSVVASPPPSLSCHRPRSLPPDLCLFFALSFLPVSPRPFIPWTLSPRTLRRSLPVPFFSFSIPLPPLPSLPLVLTQRRHASVMFHSPAAFLSGVNFIFRLP